VIENQFGGVRSNLLHLEKKLLRLLKKLTGRLKNIENRITGSGKKSFLFVNEGKPFEAGGSIIKM
jgi:hypothetical protein